MVVPPPDSFLGDESSTPTPGMDNDYVGVDSGKSTPRYVDSPSVDTMAGKMSPLVAIAQQHSPTSDLQAADGQENGSTLRDQPLSPLAVDSVVATAAENSASLIDTTSDSKVNGSKVNAKVMSIYSSAEHDSKPVREHRDLESIPSYSLSRTSTTISLESQSNGTSEEGEVEPYEGTNL